MTPSIEQTSHQFANLLPNWTLLPILTFLPNCGGFHRTLQRVRLANRGRLLLRTPGPVPFGTCICSYVETILSWTCHVYGPFEFRTSLGTSILPLTYFSVLMLRPISPELVLSLDFWVSNIPRYFCFCFQNMCIWLPPARFVVFLTTLVVRLLVHDIFCSITPSSKMDYNRKAFVKTRKEWNLC